MAHEHQTDLKRTTEPSSDDRPWHEGKALAFSEFAVVILIFIADYRHLIPFSKVPFLFLLGWISLRLRRIGWKEVGLARFNSWITILVAGVLGGVAIELFELFASQPLLIRVTGKQPDLSSLQPIAGNIKLLVLGVVFSWILAAFGEEFVFRGYLMNRVAGVAGKTRAAWIISLVLVSAVFGLGHIGQGITGQIENGIDGLFLGLLYLGFGRNLWVPIIAHGLTDTIDVSLIFLGKYPII